MDEPVVAAAEGDEVVEGGFAALAPVLAVVGVDEPCGLAAGEAAPAVACLERAPPRW